MHRISILWKVKYRIYVCLEDCPHFLFSKKEATDVTD